MKVGRRNAIIKNGNPASVSVDRREIYDRIFTGVAVTDEEMF